MKKRRIILFGVCVALYFAAYLSIRSNHYLIHRKTWANGRNYHWVESGELIDGPSAFMAIALVADENEEDFDAAEEQVMKAILRAERKQTTAGLFFFPLRVSEVGFWFCVDFRD